MTEKIARIVRPLAWRHDFIRAHDYRCHYCNRPGGLEAGPDRRPWHVDHKDPLAEGGGDVEDNLTLACKRCNIAKSTQPYLRFRAFARAAFWSGEVESASDEDLAELLDAYLDTPDGSWFFSFPILDSDDQRYRVLSRPADEINDGCDEDVAEIRRGLGRNCQARSIAEFIIHAHRLAPLLIAEVRTLRAELAEARGDLGDTASETAVA
jgi:hypothetical protein